MTAAPPPRLRILGDRVAALERDLARLTSGRPVPARPGDAGLSADERLGRVLDPGGPWFEIGRLRGHDRWDGAAGAGGLVTGVGAVAGRPVVVAASVPAAGGGAWWPETVDKLLRVQEVALRHTLPIGYLIEGGAPAVELPDGGFPGSYGPGRVLALAAAIRRAGGVQVAGVVEPLRAPAALLAEFADHRIAVGADGLEAVRARLAGCRRTPRWTPAPRPARAPAVSAGRLTSLLPADHRRSYDMGVVLGFLLDGGELDEFQPRHAAEMICGHGWIEGLPVAVIANRRGLVPSRDGGQPKVGGIIYAETADKTAYFIETASRQGLPILFVQDVSGFMLGVEAESAGIIRAGAGLVEAMATARSARITLTINHASGAGYYAMASQGFEPDFTLAWPTGRIGAMEAEAAINAVHGTAIAKGGAKVADDPAVKASMLAMRATFERDLDAVHAAARGHVDAVISPEATRETLAFLLRVTARPQPND